MQGRRAVQHNRVLFNNIFQHVPNLRLETLYHFLGRFDIVGQSAGNQFFHNERFEQLNGHFLRQTTLINLQLRTYNDNRTAGIVNTFSEKVLTETSLLTFQHIGKGFQRTISRSGNRTAAAAIINQGVNRLLKHTFFITHDNVRRSQFKKSFQTVISIDNPTVKIIQVRRSETSAIQLYHRSDIRRNHRNHCQNHPFRTVSGSTEGLHNFQTLDNSRPLLSGGVFQFLFQFVGFRFQINAFQKLFNRLGAHSRAEMVTEFLICVSVFLFGKDLLILQVCFTFIQNNIGCKIKHFFQIPRRHIQD